MRHQRLNLQAPEQGERAPIGLAQDFGIDPAHPWLETSAPGHGGSGPTPVTVMEDGRPFVSSETLLYDILVPAGRDAVVIRAGGLKFVRRAGHVTKGTLMLLISTSLPRALLARLLALRLIGIKALGTYVVMPSTDRPEFIVPLRGKASRNFFRSEAASPYNSTAKYLAKWLLASLGMAPLLQRCFVTVCGRD